MSQHPGSPTASSSMCSSLLKANIRWLLAGLLLCCQASLGAVEYQYTVLEKDVHDPGIFTQGFVLDEGWFYESSGHYGRSFVLRYPENGEGPGPEQRLALPRNIFAEGITIVGDQLYVLSWKAGKAWTLDKNSFQLIDEYRYGGEGWGLTHDGEQLIFSDGTDVLRFYSHDFELLDTRKVQLNGKPVTRLNELEYHDGMIWANQWQSNTIYAISAENGHVQATVELDELQQESATRSGESVLNGIAYDEKRDAFWITGKYWRNRYLLRFNAKP